jgi:hypothetical protein
MILYDIIVYNPVKNQTFTEYSTSEERIKYFESRGWKVTILRKKEVELPTVPPSLHAPTYYLAKSEAEKAREVKPAVEARAEEYVKPIEVKPIEVKPEEAVPSAGLGLLVLLALLLVVK